MQTVLMVLSGLGVASTVILGILYGRAEHAVGSLMVELANYKGVAAENLVLRREVAELQSEMMIAQKEKYDEMDAQELVDVFNDIFSTELLEEPDGGGSN